MRNLICITLVSLASILFVSESVMANDISKELGEMNYVMDNGDLQALLAKELCSCRYVEGLTLEQCKDRLPLPSEVFILLTATEIPNYHVISVSPNALSDIQAQATFNVKSPRKGCRLTYGRLNYK